MFTVRRRRRRDPVLAGRRQDRQPPAAPPGLPLRWAVIGMLATAGAVIGFVYGGPVAAVTTAVAVAVGAHRLLA